MLMDAVLDAFCRRRPPALETLLIFQGPGPLLLPDKLRGNTEAQRTLNTEDVALKA